MSNSLAAFRRTQARQAGDAHSHCRQNDGTVLVLVCLPCGDVLDRAWPGKASVIPGLDGVKGCVICAHHAEPGVPVGGIDGDHDAHTEFGQYVRICCHLAHDEEKALDLLSGW